MEDQEIKSGRIEVTSGDIRAINKASQGRIGVKVYKLLDVGLVDLYMQLIELGVHPNQKVSQHLESWTELGTGKYKIHYEFHVYYNTKWAKKYDLHH